MGPNPLRCKPLRQATQTRLRPQCTPGQGTPCFSTAKARLGATDSKGLTIFRLGQLPELGLDNARNSVQLAAPDPRSSPSRRRTELGVRWGRPGGIAASRLKLSCMQDVEIPRPGRLDGIDDRDGRFRRLGGTTTDHCRPVTPWGGVRDASRPGRRRVISVPGLLTEDHFCRRPNDSRSQRSDPRQSPRLQTLCGSRPDRLHVLQLSSERRRIDIPMVTGIQPGYFAANGQAAAPPRREMN